MKTCSRCQIEKPLSGFSTNGSCGHHPVCKDCSAEKARLKRLTNGDHIQAIEAAKYIRNKTSMRKANTAYCESTKEHRSEIERARYIANSESIKARTKAYRAKHPEKIRAWNGTRRADQQQAMPVWVSRHEINAIYSAASALWLASGEPHHVDHIIPLRHKLVCGLHVPANLQVLLGAENMRKSNKFVCG